MSIYVINTMFQGGAWKETQETSKVVLSVSNHTGLT